MRLLACAAIVFLGNQIEALAQETGNIAEGRALARSVCAECHAIDDGFLASPDPGATPFEIVANMPEMTAMALAIWFRTPHPSMPNLILTDQETENIVAYIHSLRN